MSAGRAIVRGVGSLTAPSSRPSSLAPALPLALSACRIPDAELSPCGLSRAAAPVLPPPPIMNPEAVHGERANSAIAADAGKPSACSGEYQEFRSPSSVLLAPWGNGQTLATSVRLSHAALPEGHRAVMDAHLPAFRVENL